MEPQKQRRGKARLIQPEKTAETYHITVEKPKKSAVKREIIISEDNDEVSLQAYFSNKEYSDINVMGIKGQPIPCHKIVLCKLPFFRAILHSPGSDYNKETNTLHVKMSQVVLNIVIGYLYDVAQPFSGLTLNGSTIVDLFDELVPLRYHAILQDIWNSIVKYVDWKTIEEDRMIDMYTRAATHKLTMQLYPRFNYNAISKLDCVTVKHLLVQEITPHAKYPDIRNFDRYRTERAKLLLAGFWCVSHSNADEKKEVLAIIKNNIVIPPNGTLTVVQDRLLPFGWCDIWMKFITVYMHGGSEALNTLRDANFDMDENKMHNVGTAVPVPNYYEYNHEDGDPLADLPEDTDMFVNYRAVPRD